MTPIEHDISELFCKESSEWQIIGKSFGIDNNKLKCWNQENNNSEINISNVMEKWLEMSQRTWKDAFDIALKMNMINVARDMIRFLKEPETECKYSRV